MWFTNNADEDTRREDLSPEDWAQYEADWSEALIKAEDIIRVRAALKRNPRRRWITMRQLHNTHGILARFFGKGVA